MAYLLLLLAVPLCLFAPITIMFVVDEICLLCKVDDDLRTIIDSAVGSIALVTYFVSPFLGAGFNRLGLVLLIQLSIFIVSLALLKLIDNKNYKRKVKPNLQIKFEERKLKMRRFLSYLAYILGHY